MVKPTDQEMIATEKRACYSQFPRGRNSSVTKTHMEKHQVGQETEGPRGKYGQGPSLWLLWEGTVKAGYAGWTDINNFRDSGLYKLSLVALNLGLVLLEQMDRVPECDESLVRAQ